MKSLASASEKVVGRRAIWHRASEFSLRFVIDASEIKRKDGSAVLKRARSIEDRLFTGNRSKVALRLSLSNKMGTARRKINLAINRSSSRKRASRSRLLIMDYH